MITITWIAVALVAVCVYLYQTYTKLSKMGIKHLPIVPFFGNVLYTFLNLENYAHTLTKLNTAFPEDKVVGMYDMLKPVYIIQDVDVIKKITVKDFDHFVDRRIFISETDTSFGRGLLNLKGEEWKQMRSTLSPAFTSSKIRLMVPFMVDVGNEMVKVLHERIKDSKDQRIDVNLKDITTRYANDVIASCAFGLKVESQSNNSQFYQKAKDITTFNFVQVCKVYFYLCFPSISNMLNIPFIAPETSGFFRDVVLSTMVEREKKNVIRHDMINILNEIKKGKLNQEKDTRDTSVGFATVEETAVGKKINSKEWTDTDLVAQAVLFLFAGFDTVSTAMSFILYELAVNPQVQEKLVQEINESDEKNNGCFDFNSIQEMKYLDMVVSESLRLHPPVAVVDRECVNDYNVGRVNKSSSQDLIIRKGDVIELPIWIFHYNSQLFPDPYKFDPERFSEENSRNIKPFSYMPFGVGPRNCIGSRFALCKVKVMLYILLRKITVIPSEKTSIPLRLVNGFLMGIQDGGWVRLQIRQ